MAATVINTNIISLDAQLNLSKSQTALSNAVGQLSSGLRVSSAASDAAGYAIAQRMTAQINGMNQAAQNANDGISLAQTAGGALQTVDTALQRMRTLALESANSTNSSTDRAALNSEAQQLLSEIQRVATTTQFNGLNLLDGSFQGSQFQVGPNANQTINVTIAGATTDVLGSYGGTSGQLTGYTTTAAGGLETLTSGASQNAWSSSDYITINGTQIGASVANGSVAGWDAGSAAAKAQAINAQSSTTGVTATASTTMTGNAAIAGSSLVAGDLSINGVSVGAVASATTSVGQAENLANAINSVTSQTGVTATYDTSSGKVTLSASDGRDINLTAASQDAATRIYNMGLTAFYGTATSAPTMVTETFAANSTPALTDSMTVNGVTFTAVSSTSTSVVNATSVQVGVYSSGTTLDTQTQEATAFQAAFVSAQAATAPTYTALQPFTATLATGGSATTFTVADSRYGTASATGDAFSGSGITATSTTAGTDVGGTGDTYSYSYGGTISLTSASNFTLAGVGNGAAYGGFGTPATATVANGATTFDPALSSLSTVNISTVSGSNSAINIIDAALTQVDSTQAELGAVQNRFTDTVSNLQTSALNLTQARSRITDANFAQQTSKMATAQILQQAGISMVAQANQLPNLVLKLLP